MSMGICLSEDLDGIEKTDTGQGLLWSIKRLLWGNGMETETVFQRPLNRDDQYRSEGQGDSLISTVLQEVQESLFCFWWVDAIFRHTTHYNTITTRYI